jgi:hypothetical protein
MGILVRLGEVGRGAGGAGLELLLSFMPIAVRTLSVKPPRIMVVKITSDKVVVT